MRVVLADPPAFTPQYDGALAEALARAGADVELVTSRFRFADLEPPNGYRRSELFYPLSSRLFRRSRARLPLKLLEHAAGLARLSRRRADVVHVQWLALPSVDARLLRVRAPTVFTAHDLLPRRTASKRSLWHRLLSRFDRIVVHSARGAETLRELGTPAARLRVIPHPVFRGDVRRADDGRTVLALGVIRSYKGLPDSIEVARRLVDARLLVVGDPAEPIDRLRAGSTPRIEWRLGYVPESEVERAVAETTVALFPYRPEIDQSGALLRVLGAGVPAVVYDVGGLAEPIRRFGAGRVVDAGDVDALTDAVRDLLEDDDALARARAGAERARAELTWDASARAHLDVYREVV